jgi:hypothetical protein
MNVPAGERPDTNQAPFATRIEAMVQSFFQFTLAYLATTKRLVVPANAYAIGAHISTRGDSRTVLPYTFLTLAYFPFAIILTAASDTIWDVLLDPEHPAAAIVKSLAEGPSPTQILISSIPVLLVVLVLRGALVSMFQVGDTGKKVLRRSLAYAYGFQFIIFTLLLFIIVLGHTTFMHTFFPRWFVAITDWIAQPIVFYSLLFFSVCYPSIALVYVAIRLRRHWRFGFVPVAVGLTAMIGTAAIIYCGTIPGRASNIVAPPGGVESHVLAPLYSSRRRDVVVGLYLYVKNTGNNTVIVTDRDFGVNLKYDNGKVIPLNAYSAGFCSWSDGVAPILSVKSEEVKWIRLNFDLASDSGLFDKIASDGYVWIKVFGLLGGPIHTEWEKVRITDSSPSEIWRGCQNPAGKP